MKIKRDGKIRDVDIRLKFIERNIKFFEQPGFEFVNEFGINSTNIVSQTLSFTGLKLNLKWTILKG